jgi:hypothetical protein
MYAISFGASRTAMVPMKTHFARMGSTWGQRGNRDFVLPKYCGSTKCDCSEISTPASRKQSHSGEVT